MNALLLLLLFGCPYVGEPEYNATIRDYDGDGVIAERFGGDDCRDDDPNIRSCDADGDGHRIPEVGGDDCDDGDALVFPGADEVCNGIDDNCDGQIDDADPLLTNAPVWFLDDDGDGYGDASQPFPRCEPLDGYASDDRDCDDSNDEVYPGAVEFCDALDRDCDGDPIAGAVDPQDWYADNDGDGFGAGVSVGQSCEVLPGTAATDDDCNDAEPLAYPGAAEIWYDGVDSDCDGGSDFDQDGDGFDTPVDCDDLDPDVSPGATEICDGGLDNDCDGIADNDDPSTDPLGQFVFYLDGDGDGEGADDSARGFCPGTEPDGWVLLSGDCDDTLDTVNSGGIEVCDSLDNDCNGTVDDNAFGQVDYYVDNDGDGYGGPTIQGSCTAQPGLALVGGDCDDADPLSYPGAPEVCGDLIRQDCTALSVNDCDSDGFDDVASGGTDCDDARADIYPGANEICDGIDNSCNGLVDDDDPAVDVTSVEDWFLDADLDGFGSPVLVAVDACAPLPGAATNADDCDDSNPDTYPGALELCDGLDNSCEGDVDEDPLLAPNVFYYDQDGDGYGTPDIVNAQGCDAPGPDWVAVAGDCADSDPNTNPDALEVCDGVDNNCDGLTDSADPTALVNTWYQDSDGDGYGEDSVTVTQCEQPVGYAPVGGDCNDGAATTNPGAAEVCDGNVDNDCDGLGDDADPDLNASVTWYEDNDGDGYGNPSVSVVQCSQPPGWVVDDSDCNDGQPAISPAAAELCDGVDNDCDGLLDDEDPNILDASLWFADMDGDLWGDANDSVRKCVQPVDRLATAGDCDDTDPNIKPTATEVCDGIDNDCDTFVDDADPNVSPTAWFEDLDLDDYGDPAVFLLQCADPGVGWANNSDDCNDLNPDISPLAPEICNYVDDNCDGQVDDDDPLVVGQLTWYADADQDGYGDAAVTLQQCGVPVGYTSNNLDCDDTDRGINPSVPVDFCNGIDDNCNGLVDDDDPAVIANSTYYPDLDGDGYGDDAQLVYACNAPPDHVPSGGDCDDNDFMVNPSRNEVCDALEVDENCNGLANEADPLLTGANLAYPDNDSDGQAGFSITSVNYCFVIPNGFSTQQTDCNDNDADTYVGAPELCDGRDNDCDGGFDEGPNDSRVHADKDGDGFGDPLDPRPNNCPTPGIGLVLNAEDCDDFNNSVFPGAAEVCDLVDNDCDGLTDDTDPSLSGADPWYDDADGDGYGDGPAVLNACTDPGTGLAAVDGDCAPNDPNINPGAIEVCDAGFVDEDCDGLANSDDPNASDAVALFADLDADGFGGTILPALACPDEVPPGTSITPGDCLDGDASAYPGAPELCDGVDNNCDGTADNNPDDTTIFFDRDGDGYGGIESATGLGCPPGSGPNLVVFGSDDCDDLDANINPGVFEVCDSIDNNCDGLADDDDPGTIGQDTFYEDLDLDGFGGEGTTVTLLACTTPGFGWSPSDTDCDDSDILISPIADEVCDGGIDNNCNGYADDGPPPAADATTWYEDGDLDGFGVVFIAVEACTQPVNYVADFGDCVDNNANIFPGANEVCNGTDDNCDSLVDDADPALDPASELTWYLDIDGDGFTNSAGLAFACTAPNFYGPPSLVDDCNDNDDTVRPNALEVCDGIDNNCDLIIDGAQAIDSVEYFSDLDGDGYGDAVNGLGFLCSEPADAATNTLDCDDTNATVYTAALEICDGLDNNCDGLVDEADPLLWSTLNLYTDADGDGYGDTSTAVKACNPTAGLVSQGGDCDDTDPSRFPGQTLNVGPGQPYTSIQAAIDVACDNTVITIDPGTYTEPLTLNGQPISLIGAGAGATILQASSPIITVPSNQTIETVISDLTLTPDGGPSALEGGGIYLAANAQISLQNLIFDGLNANTGGGIYASPGTFMSTFNLTFIDTTAVFGDLVYTQGQWDAPALTATWPTTVGQTAVAVQQGGNISATNWNIDGALSALDIDAANFYLDYSVLRGDPGALFGSGIIITSPGPANPTTLTVQNSSLEFFGTAVVAPGGGPVANTVNLFNSRFMGNEVAMQLVGVQDALVQYNAIYSHNGNAGSHVAITGGSGVSFEHNTVDALGVITTQGTAFNRLNRNILSSRGVVPAVNFTLVADSPDSNFVELAATATDLNALGSSTNQSGAPLFMTAGVNVPIEHYDLHLSPASPCIDYYVSGPLTFDADGSQSDVGAYSGNWNEPYIAASLYYYEDIDFDGMYDGWEREHLVGTTFYLGIDDFDGDGADNLTEFNAGTRPDLLDTDGDGVNDGTEIANTTNPLDSTEF